MERQKQLFSERRQVTIPGLTYVAEFITPAEEQSLIKQINAGIWSHEFARRRQHYGIGYANANVNAPVPLPPWIDAIARRIVEQKLFACMPVQALVNEYLPGQGISAHRDYEPFDEVASLSLASECLMEFGKLASTARHELWLERRSLLVLVGEARYKWTHAIRPRLNDMVDGVKLARQRRLSLTFRTARSEHCRTVLSHPSRAD